MVVYFCVYLFLNACVDTVLFDLCFCHRLTLGDACKSTLLLTYVSRKHPSYFNFKSPFPSILLCLVLIWSWVFHSFGRIYKHKIMHPVFQRGEGLLLTFVEGLLVRHSDIQIV